MVQCSCQNESKSKKNCRLGLATKKRDISPKPDKSVGPVTGGVRLNNLYTKGVISKFRPGKPGPGRLLLSLT